MTAQALKEKSNINEFSQEAAEILKLLEEIEDRTSNLRKKLIEEVSSGSAVHLQVKEDIKKN